MEENRNITLEIDNKQVEFVYASNLAKYKDEVIYLPEIVWDFPSKNVVDYVKEKLKNMINSSNKKNTKTKNKHTNKLDNKEE